MCNFRCKLITLSFFSPRGGRIELGDVTPHNIKQLKKLNQVVFPVSYNDKFYKDVLEAGELAKLGAFRLSTYHLVNLVIYLNFQRIFQHITTIL